MAVAQLNRQNAGLLLLTMGIAMVLVGLFLGFSSCLLVLNSVSTRAEVIGVRSQLPFNVVKIEFTVPDVGQVRASLTDFPLFSLNHGDWVGVRYNPLAPETVSRNSIWTLWGPCLLWILLGLILVLKIFRSTPEVVWQVLGLLGFGGRLPWGPNQKVSSYQTESANQAAPAPVRQANQSNISKPAKDSGPERTQAPSAQAVRELLRDPNLFGVLKPLVDDQSVTDIIVSQYNQVTVKRAGKTENVTQGFASGSALEAYVDRLLNAAGTGYSLAKPIVDGHIGPYIRIHAVNAVLCEGGPYLAIRLSRFRSVTGEDLINNGMASPQLLAYLREAVFGGSTVLVVGEVGTGKTTVLRGLASCISFAESILVIEDTPEIRIEHPHVRYLRTREANVEGFGRIQPSDCIRASMRMAMDRVIFGEIRDPDAAEAFVDICSSGHPGLSTFHARGVLDAVSRLRLLLSRKQPGVGSEALTAEVATAVNVIVHTGLCRKTGRLRIMKIVEIATDSDGKLIHQLVFQYDLKGNDPSWIREAPQSFFDLSARAW